MFVWYQYEAVMIKQLLLYTNIPLIDKYELIIFYDLNCKRVFLQYRIICNVNLYSLINGLFKCQFRGMFLKCYFNLITC